MVDASRRAVFLDRDGTIVEDPGFLHQPGKVRLLAGAGEAIHQLNQAGWLVIPVSNQSGIARGLYDAAAYQAVQRRLVELLAAHDARLDGAYFCPHHPEFTGPCECRKPGLLLFREAQAALGLDLTRCCWVGDRLSDVEPARKLGGRSEEHTSELQSRLHLVCRLLLEKKKKQQQQRVVINKDRGTLL